VEEVLRHQYLKSLGVVEYIPRDLVLDVEEPSSSDSAGARKKLLELHSDDSGSIEESKNQKAVVSVSAIPSAVISEDNISDIEVKFALWQPTEGVLVCCSIEEALPDPVQTQLLSNILIAMGQGDGKLAQCEIAQWPPFENMTGGKEEAREFIATLLSARLDSSDIKLVLIFGSAGAQWILSEKQKGSVKDGNVELSAGVAAIIIPSLGEMIERPELKRETWQRLQPWKENKIASQPSDDL
jgi:hypothetical protein